MAASRIRITQVRSTIGRPDGQRQTLVGLGLNKIGRTVERPNTPAIRGMVRKVIHLVEFEELDGSASS